MARASIQQVARHAGVSAMTVSRMLRGQKGLVSAKNQERILAALRDLDYVPVRTAMQNRHVKTGVIGLAFDNIFSMKTYVGAHTFEGLREAAFARNYDLLLLHSRPESSLDEQKMQFLDRRCDGFVFVSPRDRGGVLECLVQHGFPTVSCYNMDVPAGIAWVESDNAAAINQAVQTMQQAGHQDIAYISGPHSHSNSRQRCEAYCNAMHGAGLTPFWFEVREIGDVERGAAVMLRRRPSAVVCHNDHWALILWNMAREQGLQVPRDLSIIGVDDLPESAERGLTTFINPFEEIGHTAVESLLALLQGSEVEEHCRILPMKMVMRGSVAPPCSSP